MNNYFLVTFSFFPEVFIHNLTKNKLITLEWLYIVLGVAWRVNRGDLFYKSVILIQSIFLLYYFPLVKNE